VGSSTRQSGKNKIVNQAAYDRAKGRQEKRDAKIIARAMVCISAIINRQYEYRLVVPDEGHALDALIDFGAMHGNAVRKDEARMYVEQALTELVRSGVIIRSTGGSGEFIFLTEPTPVDSSLQVDPKDRWEEIVLPPHVHARVEKWKDHTRQSIRRGAGRAA
jgi:hypothetical protein